MLRRYRYDRAEMLKRVLKRLLHARAPRAVSVIWTDAIFGWGNERWTAEAPYLREVVASAEKAKGPILECGSGLTTLMMGAIASRRGIQLHSLEHNPEWHARVSEAIEQFHLTNVTVHLAPLRDFGSFDWYDVPLADPCALQDPFVGRVDHPFEVGVREQARRYVSREARDSDAAQIHHNLSF